MPHHRTIMKVTKYKCLIKTEHGFSRHQFAKPCHNAKLIVYLFTYRGHMLLKRKIFINCNAKKFHWVIHFQIQSLPRALLRMSYARISEPVSTGVENGSRLNWKNLSEQEREPTTNSIHIWCRREDSNSGHIGRRRVLSHHCTTLAPQQFHLSLFSTSELFSTAHDQRTRRAHRAEAPMIGTLFPWLGRA